MSDFIPVEVVPYWTAPRRPAPEKKADAGQAPAQADAETHLHQHGRHLNETLARFLHAFHLHYYGEPAERFVQPRVDVVESKAAFTAYVELPGLAPGDVHVEADEHFSTVSLSGELKQRVHGLAAGDVAVEHKGAAASEAPPEAGKSEGAKEMAPAAEEEGRQLRWHIEERVHGPFHRVLQLPVGFVDMEGTRASMADGLLTITVPKRASGPGEMPKKTRKVEVVPENQETGGAAASS